MAVSHEIKSQLAKLLATEDLVVEHKQCESAQFDVHTRVLTLPLWEKASNVVYDMLVGHEVGHALFTPDEDWSEELKIPKQFVNVVEDARIEKLMKRKYAGLAKTFYRGYNELHDKDFFELDGEDITTFNLADRANLFFKVGSFVDLVFSTAEKQIISLIDHCETFEDTKKVALVLYKFCKEEQQSPQVSSPNDQDVDMDPDGGFFDDVKEDGEKDEMQEEEVETKTEEILNKNLKNLVNEDGVENVYIEIPDLDIDKIIVENDKIHEEIDNYFNDRDTVEIVPQYYISEIESEYVKFKKDAQKEVSYLVKEFECKKAATAYSRTSVSKTGILDTAKLHTYKFNEELFKRINVLPDGKNHGLIFILDWSGSMLNVMQDTLKQLYHLIWFCKKVSIPFDVYAFTNEWRRGHKCYETGQWSAVDMTPYYKKKENLFFIEEKFSLMNLFTHNVSSKELEHQLKNIWKISRGFGFNRIYPPKLSLSGTPLNQSLVCLHKIIPQFQKQNNLEKVQCIVLTDGEADPLDYHAVFRRRDSKPFLGCRRIKFNWCFLRDRKLGKIYKFSYEYHYFVKVILQNLRDNFPSTNFIGIRILSSREAGSFVRTFYSQKDKEYGIIMKDWRKSKSFNIMNSGYHAYFGISSNSLAEDCEFDVEEDATKAQIKKAFVNSRSIKKLNKKVLGEFISLVV